MKTSQSSELPEEILEVARDPSIQTIRFSGNRREFLFREGACIGWIEFRGNDKPLLYRSKPGSVMIDHIAAEACVDSIPELLDNLIAGRESERRHESVPERLSPCG